jgi:hypothetical protein
MEKTNAILVDCYFESLQIAREMSSLFDNWDLEFYEFSTHCTRIYNFHFKMVMFSYFGFMRLLTPL